jgi:hypothetical protein
MNRVITCDGNESGEALTEPWVDAEWIRNRLRSTGMTQRALAQALELDPSAVSRLLDGSRQLKGQEIPKVIDFFQASSSAPATGQSDSPGVQIDSPRPSRTWETFGGQHPSRSGRPSSGPRAKQVGQMPTYGLLPAKTGGFYALDALPTEYRPSPPQLAGVNDAFALFVPDEKLSPRYRMGEVIYVHPNKPPIVGSYVVIRLRPPERSVAIGEILNVDETKLELRLGAEPSGNRAPRSGPANSLTLRRDEIASIGPIVVAAVD